LPNRQVKKLGKYRPSCRSSRSLRENESCDDPCLGKLTKAGILGRLLRRAQRFSVRLNERLPGSARWVFAEAGNTENTSKLAVAIPSLQKTPFFP
jgi:hypothetical protein